jgi:catechol 2,3-dioxygenase
MPIPSPVFNPPFNIVRVSHVEFGVADLDRSHAFYVECLGYAVSARYPDALHLRAVEERNHHSVILRKKNPGEALAIGFKVTSEDDLDRAQAWFTAQGLANRFIDVPHQGRTLRADDPHGTPLEFYFKMDQADSLLQKYGEHRGARIQRIDHVNCFTPDVQKSVDFYNALGFRPTEYTETEDANPQLWAVWLHRKGNVHDMALTNGRGPRLHHIGVWTSTPMDILNICDVMATTGYLPNMERGPGRHGISNAFFLYIRDPDGHRIELFTSDYLTADPDHAPIRWSLRNPQRQTLWGHPAPQSWFDEGSNFPGVEIREPVLKAQPIVAR